MASRYPSGLFVFYDVVYSHWRRYEKIDY